MSRSRNLGLGALRLEMSMLLKRSVKEMVGFKRVSRSRNLGLRAFRLGMSMFSKRGVKGIVAFRRGVQI